MITADIAIIGAGMAGASLAAAIGNIARVILIEADAQPGYHATGRSAAFWSETYGGPAIQPLTTASHGFLDLHGFLHSRGALHIATTDEVLDDIEEEFAGTDVRLDRINRNELEKIVPHLKGHWVSGIRELSCRDIDVAALHAHYLKEARGNGAKLLTDAEAQTVRHDGANWVIETRAGIVSAPIIVNAAGAWASVIARMAGAMTIEIAPLRRTVLQLVVDPPAPSDLPLVIDAAGSFYIKPETAGRLWLSPHDETASVPCDAVADELDIAVAIDRFERAFDWRVVKLERTWAGLRSFAPDRAPVYGFDQKAPGFFWFAGQGGFGIQTAPAAAAIGAALLLRRPVPDAFRHIDIDLYSPARF